MKWARMAILLVIVLGAGALAARLSLSSRGYATPAACMEAYREAILAGDAPRFLDCLAEPLRSQHNGRCVDSVEMVGILKSKVHDVKAWGQSVQMQPGDSIAVVDVDEVRVHGTRRVRYRLEQTSRGWLIAEIGPPKDMPTEVPYGTHISKGAKEK